MSNDSVLFSASVAKILVTVAVLQQVEKGRFSLDDDIDQFVPFKVRNPAWPDVPITWRMLLTHTSSMKSEDDERASATETYGRDASTTLDDYAKNAFVPGGSYYWAERFASGKPGTERIYSNDAFDLAGSALQSIVHEPLYKYIDEEILAPLGMKSTSYWIAGRRSARYAVAYASVRQKDGRYDYVPAKIYWAHGQPGGSAFDYQMTAPNYASGTAHTTALDFARLMLMLMNGGAVDGKRILQQSSVDLMMTPIGLRNLDGWAQGLGLAGPKDIRGRQVWGHDGEDRGAANALLAVVVCASCGLAPPKPATHSILQSPESDLIGTWRLVLADDRPNNREAWVHSYGDHPRGYLIYDVSGHMSIQFGSDPPTSLYY